MAAHRSARRRLYLAVIAFSALVGVVCAGFNSGLGPFPPNGEENGLEIATATTHVMVDTPASSPPLAFARALPQDVRTAADHAELLGRVAVTPPVLERIAGQCRVSPDEISGQARTTASVPTVLLEPDSERRAVEIQASRSRYRLEVQGRPFLPVFDVYTQAPSAGQAECLADAVVVGLRGYLRTLTAEGGNEPSQIRLHEIGAARGVVVNQRAPLAIAGLTLLTVFALSCALLLGLVHLRDRRSAANTAPRPELPPPSNGAPDGERRSSGWLDLLRSRLGARDPRTPLDDHWPRTWRVLPWTLAGFIALLWLVPFNSLTLNVSLPINLSLDRIVLPVVAISWVLALVAESTVAPRLRLTWIHAALGAFLIVALLSVVLDARYLNQTLELGLSLKKLPLLVSYVSLFVITASAVRRKEVPAFLSYTLLLAVVCAVGIIYEYRSTENLFWHLSDSLLPGFTLLIRWTPELSTPSAGGSSSVRRRRRWKPSRSSPWRSRSPSSACSTPGDGERGSCTHSPPVCSWRRCSPPTARAPSSPRRRSC